MIGGYGFTTSESVRYPTSLTTFVPLPKHHPVDDSDHTSRVAASLSTGGSHLIGFVQAHHLLTNETSNVGQFPT